MEQKSIRARFFTNSLYFVGVLIAVSAIAIYFFFRNNQQNEIVLQFEDLQVKIQKGVLAGQNFLIHDISDSRFYVSGKSDYITASEQIFTEITNELAQLDEKFESSGFDLKSELELVSSSLSEYQTTFKTLVEKVQTRGFKDYGNVGEMRAHVHDLEMNGSIAISKILTLRRHEKDYLIRTDVSYANQLISEISKLKNELEGNTSQSAKENIDLLTKYADSFNQVVELDKEIGLKANIGLSAEIKEKTEKIEAQIQVIEDKVLSWKKSSYETLIFIFLGFIVLAVISSLILSDRIALKVTRPIRELAQMIDLIVVKDFDLRTPSLRVETNDEVGNLTKNFNIMLERIRSTLHELEKKSHQDDDK